jgi:hypothetical protein
LIEKYRLLSRNREYGLGIRHTDHVAPSIRKKLAITSPTSGGRSVGVVRSRTQTMEFVFIFLIQKCECIQTTVVKNVESKVVLVHKQNIMP